jgi:putative oxidoreductase
MYKMGQNMSDKDRIAQSLFVLRASIFLVMLVWTLDKFINPEHAVAVFESFYGIKAATAQSIMSFVAFGELVLIIAFVAGIKKNLTYGLVLLFNTIATISAWKMYIDPFAAPNILFWAAWPMLAACFALYMLRDMDTKCAMGCTKTEKKAAPKAAATTSVASTSAAPVKKAAPKKAASKKAATKKAATKKAAAKKTVKSAATKKTVKKAPVKKAAAKKPAVKKAAAKKAVKKAVKKAPAKKAAAKKTAAKKKK